MSFYVTTMTYRRTPSFKEGFGNFNLEYEDVFHDLDDSEPYDDDDEDDDVYEE